MTTESTKLQLFLSRALYLLCLLFFIITLWNTITYFYETFEYKPMYHFVIIGFLIIIILTAFILDKFINKTIFLILLVALAIVLRLVWILNVHTPPISDFSLMYTSALHAAKGDYSFSELPYYRNWVYQIGFTMYEAGIVKLFGQGTFALKLLNMLYAAGTSVLVYKIAAKLFNETAGRIAGIFYAVLVPGILLSSVLTNQHLSTFLFYLSFYLLISYPSKKYLWIISGILISLGDIIRPLGSVVLLAIGIYLFITQFLGTEKKQKLITVKNMVGIVAVFYLVHFLASQLFISMGVTQYPLSNRDPLWKFVLGFNHETVGQYSQPDLDYVSKFNAGPERNAVEMKMIKQRLADKSQVLNLFQEKLDIMWGSNDASTFWSVRYLHDLYLENRIKKLERLMFISFLVLGILAFIRLSINKTKDRGQILFALLILGYVAVHLLIEIQTRYRYDIMPSFMILLSYGASTIVDGFKQIKKR